MTYLVIARDGNDEGAPMRRRQVREEHLREIAPLVEAGTVLLGGALLDDEGRMVGSALIVEAASKDAVHELLSGDIYSRAGVWLSLEIVPFKRAV